MHESIGSVAAVLTTSAFLPQAIRTIRTRDTRGLSLWTWVLFVSGVLCWLVYGVLVDSAPVTWANAITALFAAPVLVVKAWNVRTGRDRRPASTT